jgi:outer membrane protein assembly factor BamB
MRMSLRGAALLLVTGLMFGGAIAAQEAAPQWGRFRYDAANTGRCPYTGPSTNTKVWDFSSGSGGFHSAVAIAADGTIYAASGDTRLYALNPDGSKKWEFLTGDYIITSSPSIGADGTVYVGSDDKKLHAVNPDGTKKWAFDGGGKFESSPATGPDGTVYVGCQDGKVYAVNPDGTQKWAFATGGAVRSSPAIAADGTIYVGSDDSHLYALHPGGTQKWSFAATTFVETSPAVGADGTVYVGDTGGNLFAVNPDGTRKWSFDVVDYAPDNTPNGKAIYSSPAMAADGTIYFGCRNWRVYAVNPNGTLKWKVLIGEAIDMSSPVVDARGIIYIGANDYKLHAFNPDGSKKWEFATEARVYRASPAIGADGTLYLGDSYRRLYALRSGNHAPVAGDQNVAVVRDTAKAITLTATDVDNDLLTYTVIDGPAHGALSGAAPNVTYTPANGWTGADSFTFKANDGQIDSNVATVAITVANPNNPPVIDDASPASPFSMPAGATQVFAVSASDVDGDALTYVWKLDFGADVPGTEAYGYSPAEAAVGPHLLQVTVSDGRGGSACRAWNLTVTSLATIGLTPTAMSFTTPAPGSNPAAQTASITNAGPGTLRWTASGNRPWLQVSPFSGAVAAGTDTLTVSAVASQPEAWGNATTTTGAPSGREDQSQVWTGKEMIVWGGRVHITGTPTNTGARYDPANDAWLGATSTANAPPATKCHSGVWTGREMIVWGGWNSGWVVQNAGYRYDPATNTWLGTISSAGAPSARRSHTAVWTGTEMIVWGGDVEGAASSTPTATGARYNPATDTWTTMSTDGAPSARWHHSAIWTGTEMVVWGGHDGTAAVNSGARYNPATDTWTGALTTTGTPSARQAHSAVWTGTEMIVWGGNENDNYIATGGRYDLANDTWIDATTATAAPSARRSHRAIWTGAEMIVWGGFRGTYQQTGQRYRPPISLPVGSYSGTVTVADAFVANSPRTISVTLVIGNHLPVIDSFSPADPVTVLAGSTERFDVYASDPDGDILTYTWKLDSGADAAGTESFTYSPTVADVGAHTIRVTVTDGRGGSVEHTWSVTVLARFQRDFTGDGKADILWRETATGKTVVWTMDGATKTASAYTSASASLAWAVAGVADFTGDGKADILWRETLTGKTVVWTMNGATKTASAYTSASAGTGWVVSGVADFTGDGKADILWRESSSGKTVVWTMNGATKTASAYTSASASNAWVVAGVADFTGDGMADILWRDTTGKTVVWTMNGATKTASAYTSASAGTTWVVSGVADFTGDGKADILWRENGTGKTVVWTMNGATKTASAYTSASASTAWAVVQLSDFTGDGKADILWRETATGKAVVWTMNGATKTASAYTSASAGTGWVVQ